MSPRGFPLNPNLKTLLRLAGVGPALRSRRAFSTTPPPQRRAASSAKVPPTLPNAPRRALAAGVEPAVPDDERWVKPLLRSQEHVYGGDVSWRRYWRSVRNGHPRAVAEFWDVVRPFGFVHWRLRRDGSRAVDELVVAGVAREMGVGSRLLANVGLPCEVHSLAGDQRAAAFLKKLDFQPQGTVPAVGGKVRHVVWWGQ